MNLLQGADSQNHRFQFNSFNVKHGGVYQCQKLNK
jgi:hypothetical protein